MILIESSYAQILSIELKYEGFFILFFIFQTFCYPKNQIEINKQKNNKKERQTRITESGMNHVASLKESVDKPRSNIPGCTSHTKPHFLLSFPLHLPLWTIFHSFIFLQNPSYQKNQPPKGKVESDEEGRRWKKKGTEWISPPCDGGLYIYYNEDREVF